LASEIEMEINAMVLFPSLNKPRIMITSRVNKKGMI
jgi:hypothetical protein